MFISGTAAGSAYRATASRASSGLRGLIPKSTGGRVAMGAGALVGGGAVLAASRNRRSSGSQGLGQEAFRNDVSAMIASGRLGVPQGATSMRNTRTGEIIEF